MWKLVLVFLSLIFSLILPINVHAQEIKEEFYKAEVLSIKQDKEIQVGDSTTPYQQVELRILDGEKKDQIITIDHGGSFRINPDQKVNRNEIVILTKLATPDGEKYLITDKYRISQLGWLFALFAGLVFLVTGKKGFGALLGLAISLAVVVWFITPRILAGNDPLLISILGSIFILTITIYLAHGFKKQTTIALISTLITLVVTGILAVFFTKISGLTGMGSEEAYSLQLGGQMINLSGLLLGGIIIGTLGILDDITTSQTAAVYELHHTDNSLSFDKLVKKALNIGKEHISSLVNTLVLAYAGASLPLFILFVSNPRGIPLEIIINGEIIAEEIVRSLVGSIGLILAVPITTAMAAWYVTHRSK